MLSVLEILSILLSSSSANHCPKMSSVTSLEIQLEDNEIYRQFDGHEYLPLILDKQDELRNMMEKVDRRLLTTPSYPLNYIQVDNPAKALGVAKFKEEMIDRTNRWAKKQWNDYFAKCRQIIRKFNNMFEAHWSKLRTILRVTVMSISGKAPWSSKDRHGSGIRTVYRNSSDGLSFIIVGVLCYEQRSGSWGFVHWIYLYQSQGLQRTVCCGNRVVLLDTTGIRVQQMIWWRAAPIYIIYQYHFIPPKLPQRTIPFFNRCLQRD